ncbi:MAG: hypothetical protein AB8H86_18315 [Polyangiales bacterium]
MPAKNLTRTELRPLSDAGLLAIAARCVERAAMARDGLHMLPKKHLSAWTRGYAMVVKAIAEGSAPRPSPSLAKSIRNAGAAVYWDLDKKGLAHARLVSSSYEVPAAAVEAAAAAERKVLVSGVITTAGALRSLAARFAHDGYLGADDVADGDAVQTAIAAVFSVVRADIDEVDHTDPASLAARPLWNTAPSWWPSSPEA